LTTLKELLKTKEITNDNIAMHLNNLSLEQQIKQVRMLTPGLVKKMYDIAEQNAPCTMNDIVPNDIGAGVEVRHKGINSLPISRLFEKRFTRNPKQSDQFWGYNQQSLMWLTGPGFFTVNSPEQEQLFIDYRSIPENQFDKWPEMKPNEKGISKLVYAGMQDYMRKVSDRVTVGDAWKNGKKMNQFFMLVRLDPGDETTPLP
tara:strand:+ start:287 stop:892 length:606 start_codon:yes stop_codon:yes gene_type:complete